MNITEYLLTCISEECAEIQQAVAKAQRFGLDDKHPERNTTNRQDIEREIVDLVAVIDLCRERDILPLPSRERLVQAHTDKKEKVLKFMEYAKNKGTMTSN